MDFTVTVSDDDWDTVKGGWRCPALQIPEIKVEDVYVNGSAADRKLFDVNKDLCLIRWASKPPRTAAIHLRAPKELSTQELTSRWKKMAIILPVLGSIATAVVTANIKTPAPPAPSLAVQAAGPRIFERSNDFLASGQTNQFESVLKGTKREAWFLGTSFYISADQYRDLLRTKLQEGIDLHFVIFDPVGGNLRSVASALNIPEQELAKQCEAGIRTLASIADEARRNRYAGKVQVKLVSEHFHSRLYFFDPKSEVGFTYYIPYVNRANSQSLPGFLVNNGSAKYHAVYFDSILRLWNSEEAQALDAWISKHPNFS